MRQPFRDLRTAVVQSVAAVKLPPPPQDAAVRAQAPPGSTNDSPGESQAGGDACAVCGRPKGISHAERHHTFAWRRQEVLRRRRALQVLTDAIGFLEHHGTPISDPARATFQRLSRGQRPRQS